MFAGSSNTSSVSAVETFRFSLLIFGVLLVMKYLFSSTSLKRRILPPGPRGLPVVGNLLQLGKNPHLAMTELSRQYGSVYKLQFGSRMVVVVNGMDAIKQALLRQPMDFATRPEMYSSNFICDGHSVVFGSLPVEEHRRYRKLIVDALKSYALKKVRSESDDTEKSRPIVESIVTEEASNLSGRLIELSQKEDHNCYKQDGKGNSEMVGIFNEIAWTTSNIICAFLFGERHKPGDSHINFILDNNNDFSKVCASSSAVDMMPWIRYIFPGILKDFINVTQKFNDFMQSNIRKHLANFDAKYNCAEEESVETTNVMDGLIDICRKNKGNPLYNEAHTLNIVTDLMGAGFDTISKCLMWLTVYSAVFEDAQKKIQREIDDFLFREKRPPSYSERSKFPFMEAFIHEVIRHSSFVPFTIPHSVSRDNVRLYGYDLPKGTIVFINQWSVNHDRAEWKSPEHFRPERFLDVDGNFVPEIGEKVMIFGMGKRVCPGKPLAKIEMFLFLVEILKECNLSMHPDHPGLPATEYGLTMRPETGKMIVTSRC